MPINVQTPTAPVQNANSYISLADARQLAQSFAIELPTDDTEAETALVKAFLYVDSNEPKMSGTRATTTQNTAYPRDNVYIRCNAVSSDAFPNEVLLGQVIAAEAFGAGDNLFGGADSGRSIASEQVATISVSYFDNGKTGDKVTLPQFENVMLPLYDLSRTGTANFNVWRA